MGQSQVPSFIGPSRIVGNIRNDHSLFRKRGGAARTSVGTDRPRCDGRRKCGGNGRGGPWPKLRAVYHHQTNPLNNSGGVGGGRGTQKGEELPRACAPLGHFLRS